MTEVQIEIVANSKDLLQDMFDKDPGVIESGQTCSVAGTEAKISLVDYDPTLGFGLNEVFNLLLSFPAGVTSGIVANWLYEKIKKSAVSIKLNGRTVRLRLGELQLTLERLSSPLDPAGEED